MTHPAEGKLLPCPFCGAQPTTDRAGTPGKFGPIPTVRCTNEECFGPHTTAQFLADAVKQWNTRRSQGGKASMTSANLAALIHEARFPEGKDAPNYIPFLHEDRSGREYCLRIARKIIEAIELAPTPSPAESAAVAAERERCAKLCDIWVDRYGSGDIQYITPTEFASDAVKDIADAIRRGVNAPALPREESNG